MRHFESISRKTLFSFLQTEILDETIRYIDSLHDQLLATIKTKGLPTSLRQSLEAHKGKIIRTPPYHPKVF